ncbi:MAG: energy-coupling factor transporter ATP-binding protein [Burkholderiaceae bacterium]|nr:energy-coupling factor transporter ATP-binding protein [Burkholderiaceae bacterium]
MIPLLLLRGIRKRFDGRLLFEIDELAIEAGSATVLVGPNGSGKSTLLRILGGLDTADIAQAEFHGQPLSLSPYPQMLREAVVYVHQHPVMFSTSVVDNIAYGLKLRGISGKALAHQVDEAMEWAGVTHLREHRPDTLSGGEKQRVALARAKVLLPELLLLDEPTSSLDGAAREQVVALIPDLIRAGSSVVMASHDHDLSGQPGLRHLELRDGRMTSDKSAAIPSAILRTIPNH